VTIGPVLQCSPIPKRLPGYIQACAYVPPPPCSPALLQLFGFSSERKMSCCVLKEDSCYRVYNKGAGGRAVCANLQLSSAPAMLNKQTTKRTQDVTMQCTGKDALLHRSRATRHVADSRLCLLTCACTLLLTHQSPLALS
jgi:hypothetical protein